MKTRFAATRHALLTFAVLLLPALLFWQSEAAMDGIRQGLSLCGQTLLPSLFPFLVLSELLIAMGVGRLLGKLLGKPVKALFGLSAQGATVLLLGALCGQPVATVSALALHRRSEMEKEELGHLLLFANNPSSGFLIGAVGNGLFGNKSIGAALFCITWFSAAIVGIALRFLRRNPSEIPNIPQNGIKKAASVSLITDAVRQGFFAMLQICAFVLFFSCIASCVTPIAEALSLPPIARVAIYGLLELSSGISHAVTILPPITAFRAAAFFSGFAGLSVCLQIFSIAEGSGMRIAPYLLAKLTQGALCLLLAELYLRLLRPSITLQHAVGSFAARDTATWLPALLCFVFILALAFFKRKKEAP